MSKLHVFSLPVLIIVVTCIRCSSAKLCDIKAWYKEIKDGKVIPKYPTDEQQKIKDYIEKKIANLQYSGSRKMDCDVLEDYKDTLSKRSLKDLSSRKNKKKDASKTKGKDEMNNVNQDMKQKEEVDERDKKGTTKADSKSKKVTTKIDPNSKKKETEVDPKNKNKDTDVDSKSNSKIPRNDEKVDIDPTESEIDETELSEEEMDEEVTTKENENGQNNQESKQETPTNTEENGGNFHNMFEEELRKSKENSERKKDRTDAEKMMEKSSEEPKSKNREEPDSSRKLLNPESYSNFNSEELPWITEACDLEDQCSSMCYFRYQNLQSLDHYPHVQYQNSHNSHEQEGKLDKDATPNHPNIKEHIEESGTNENKVVAENRDDIQENQPTESNKDSSEKDSTKEESFSDRSPEDEISNDQKKRPEPVEDNGKKESEKKEPNNLEKTEKEETHAPEIPKSKETEQSRPTSDPSMSKEHFDLLFQKSASEYSSKIQQLEILLMKLENQLLSQELHKQNDTNSYTKLEFQILKLENELLKLNQSYSRLNEEHETLKTQRGEIEDQLKQQNKVKYAALPEGNTTKHTELINQQQVKISQLTEWLNNQSSILNRLRDKSDHLAEQNQILHQIVMNQTALISNIMQKMQDLSVENLSHRKETEDLKSKFQIQDASAKIIDRLESLASSRKVNPEKTDGGESVVEVSSHGTRRFNFLPDTPNASINRHQWTCNGSNSTQICYMFSLLLTPCPPFSTVYWRKCPKFILEKTVSFFESYMVENPDGDLRKKPLVQPSVETLAMTGNHKEETASDKLEEQLNVDKKNTGRESTEDSAGRNIVENKETRKVVEEKDGNVPEKQEIDTKPVETSSESEKNEKSQNQKEKQAGDEGKNENEVEKTNEPEIKQQEEEEKEEEEGRPIKYKNNGTRRKAIDCYELYQRGSTRNGVYKIFLPGLKYFVDVFCDMKQGGWTVIHKREGGRLDFYRDWNNYKDGFGTPLDEYYLGNDNIHFLTNQGHYTLLVELTDWKKEKRTATYKDFWIDDENDGYMLHLDGFGGDAGDGLTKHSGMKFSTFDVDNDKVVKQFGGSCAKRFHGAGWYHKCYSSNLNGKFYRNGEVPPKQFDGIAWKPWTGPNYSLKNVVMKVRPKDVLDD